MARIHYRPCFLHNKQQHGSETDYTEMVKLTAIAQQATLLAECNTKNDNDNNHFTALFHDNLGKLVSENDQIH